MADIGNEDQVEKRVEKVKDRRQLEIIDINDVLSTPAGRRLVWRILDWTGCEGTPKRNDDAHTYMAIGSGDVGRWLKSEIIAAGESLLFEMMRENMEKSEGKNVRSKH